MAAFWRRLAVLLMPVLLTDAGALATEPRWEEPPSINARPPKRAPVKRAQAKRNASPIARTSARPAPLVQAAPAPAPVPQAQPSRAPSAAANATPDLKSFYGEAPAKVRLRPTKGVPLKDKSDEHTQHLDFDGYAKVPPKKAR